MVDLEAEARLGMARGLADRVPVQRPEAAGNVVDPEAEAQLGMALGLADLEWVLRMVQKLVDLEPEQPWGEEVLDLADLVVEPQLGMAQDQVDREPVQVWAVREKERVPMVGEEEQIHPVEARERPVALVGHPEVAAGHSEPKLSHRKQGM